MDRYDYKYQVADMVTERLTEIIKRDRITQEQVGNILNWKQPLVSSFLRMTTNDAYFKKFSTDQVFYVAEKFKIKLNIKIK